MPDAAEIVIESPVAEAPPEAAQAATTEPAERRTDARSLLLSSLRGPDTRPRSVSNVSAPEKPKDGGSGADEESTDDESVSKPSAAPPPGTDDKPPSRREQERQAKEARIAELEAAVEAEKQSREDAIAKARDEARAEVERERAAAAEREQQESLSKKHLEDVERLQRLMRVPDAELSNDDYAWREAQKQLLARYPEAERYHKALAEQSVQTERDAVAREIDNFWAGVYADLASAKDVPGVDFDAVKAAKTFAERDQILYAAGAAQKDAEYAPQLASRDEKIAQLEDEIRDLKLVGPRGLGSNRAPVSGGRSASTEARPSSFDPDRSWRQNLAAAVSDTSNGRRG